MTGDPLRKLLPGERLNGIPAAAWNQFIDAANWVKAQKASRGAADGSLPNRDFALVKNASGQNRERFDVLCVSGPVLDPGDNEADFLSKLAVIGITPETSLKGRFVVLAEPIADGSIGRGYIDGACPAWINGEGDFCDIKDGEQGYLQAASSGSARILWADGGSGERWAIILFGAGGTGNRWGKAAADWTEFSELDVTVWTGTPASGSESDPVETVTCIAPGTDGDGMEGVIGLILPVDGYGPTIKHQFVPLQCEPTPPESA